MFLAGRKISLLQSVQYASGAHLAPSSVKNLSFFFFLGVKQSPYEDGHSSPSSAAVKNEWIYTSTYMCLHTAYGDEFFTFIPYIPLYRGAD
jgi:hypothetical protein